jgi:hypothetical protein
VQNEGHVSARKAPRKRRDGIRPKTEIKDRHREVVSVGPRHGLGKTMAYIDDDRASPDESRLEIHCQQQIVFDNKNSNAAQWTIVVHRLNHRPFSVGDSHTDPKVIIRPNGCEARMFRCGKTPG